AEPGLALTQSLLGVAPIRDVASDLGEAAQLPVRSAERGDHDVGPELRAVLADAPPLIGDAAHGRGPREQAIGLSVALLIRVEDRNVPSDDLAGRVALEALGSWIPTLDRSIGIEHEEGVVLHPVDQEAETLLALAHIGFRLFELP